MDYIPAVMKAILILAAMVALASSVRAADEKVEITGSPIKQKVRRIGLGTDAVAPVLVIDRNYIDRTGAFTVADVLR
jgi:outer membrane cobalamin receptor